MRIAMTAMAVTAFTAAVSSPGPEHRVWELSRGLGAGIQAEDASIVGKKVDIVDEKTLRWTHQEVPRA